MNAVVEKTRAPLPPRMPGIGCRLAYDKLAHKYILYVDDEDETSYEIGPNVRAMRNIFLGWGFDESEANSLIDLATEFRSAIMLDDGQTIPDIPRKKPGRGVNFNEELEDRKNERLPWK